MKTPLPGLGLAALAAAVSPAAGGSPVGLRYQFAPGQTKAYRFTLETAFQDQPATLAGVVFVIARSSFVRSFASSRL